MIVMLRHPEAVVAQSFAVLGQSHGVADGLALGPAGDGDRLVENGKTHDALNVGTGGRDAHIEGRIKSGRH